MHGFVIDIESETTSNDDYRRVLYTSHYTQLVVMSIKPGDEIGNEQHGLDQFIRVESGTAQVLLNNGQDTYELSDGWSVVIPAGTWHNVINSGDQDLKLYTLYSPPEHRFDVVQHSKVEEKEVHFDGIVSESA